MSTALVYGGPAVLTVEQLVDPPVPAGSVVVTPVAVGICGSDVHGYEGKTGRRGLGQVMGHEVVGVVADPGSTSLLVGAPVAINPVVGCGHCEACLRGDTNMCETCRVMGVDLSLPGGLSDRLVVPAANVVPLASGDPACALIEPLSVALQAVRSVGRVEDVAGKTVVVIGSGMVGLACAWAAARDGAGTVIVSDIALEKVANATRVGAIGVVTSAEKSLSDAVREVTDAPIDIVIDAVGYTGTLDSALSLVSRGGVVCLVGMGSPDVSLVDYRLITRQVRLVGTWCYAPRVFEEIAAEVSSSPSSFSWMVDYEVPLAEAPALFERLAHGYSPQLKVLVRPTLAAG